MVRCWGGNVYPEQKFYDFCDRRGIMVWQDFAMACGTYPQDDEFAEKMKKEAEAVVRLYRNHPSLVLWTGDNECDQMAWQFAMKLMGEQIRQFFGYTPKSLEEFSFLSQISQAEANKFYIELFRCNKPVKTGLIWWNLIDGWPQFSDAVVDWYFEKKIAYYYIKRVQQPVCVMLSEMENWHHRVVIANDTLKEVTVKYRVTDADTKDVLAEGSAVICANGIQNADSIRLYYSDKKMLLIDYEVDGVKHKNHYLCGLPPFSPEHYRKWYGMLEIN